MEAKPKGKVKPDWKLLFKFHEKFNDPVFVSELMAFDYEKDGLQLDSKAKMPEPSLSSYITSLYRYAILNRRGEWMLFMKMNYAKYMASLFAPNIKTDIEAAQEHTRYINMAMTARDIIAKHNLRLVLSCIRMCIRREITFAEREDLICHGNMTLMSAIDNFDPNRTNKHNSNYNKFSTYATWSVTNNFRRADRKQLPISANDIYDMQLADNNYNEPAVNDNIAMVMNAIKTLDPRSQKILSLKIGINCEPHTLEAIGNNFGLSKERVRQIHCKALKKIRHKLDVVSPRKRKKPAYSNSTKPLNTA